MRQKIGLYLRNHHPGIYSRYLKLISGAPFPYVLDYLGGSFKDYFLKENMQERIITLKNNLDVYSVHTIDTLIQRFLNYPEAKFSVRMNAKSGDVIGGLLQEETKDNRIEVAQALNKVKRNYAISRSLMEPSIFYYHHGLALVPEKVRKYVKGQDFIDLGAYNGDSALALYQYDFKKIYSVEMSGKSIEQYEKLMQRNKIDPSKYQLINVAIAAQDNLPPICLSDTGSSNLTVNGVKPGELAVEQRSLDTLVKEYHITPKFIKADVEGCSLELVKGAKETLKKYRPVMGISIYHNPYEFFEVKPYIESIVDNYTYMIRKLTISPFEGGCHGETTLIAYPNEIMA